MWDEYFWAETSPVPRNLLTAWPQGLRGGGKDWKSCSTVSIHSILIMNHQGGWSSFLQLVLIQEGRKFSPCYLNPPFIFICAHSVSQSTCCRTPEASSQGAQSNTRLHFNLQALASCQQLLASAHGKAISLQIVLKSQNCKWYM